MAGTGGEVKEEKWRGNETLVSVKSFRSSLFYPGFAVEKYQTSLVCINI